MPSEHTSDQAEGLRRLLLRPSLRVITVVGAQDGMGATSVVTGLAQALARQDKQVLILDENLSSENVANRLQLKPRYDLLNTVRDHMRVREVLLHASARVHVLPVARAMQSLATLDDETGARLLDTLNSATYGMDIVLVDAATSGHSVCTTLQADEPLLLVLDGTPEGITASYALLKQMALQHGRQRFDILVNKVQDEAEAGRIYDNMESAARRYLAVKLHYLGHVPRPGMMGANFRADHLLQAADAQTAHAFAGLAARLLPPERAEENHKALDNLMARMALQKSAMPRRKVA